jgi:LysM repeat protein
MRKYLKKSVVIAVLVVVLLTLTATVAFASGGNYHTVCYGETLFSIGRYYGVNPYSIADVNNLYNPHHIYAGQVLYIPSSSYYDGCYDDCNDGWYNDNYYDDSYWGSYQDGCYDCGYYDAGYYDGGYDGGYHHGWYDRNYHFVSRGETLTSIAYHYGVSPWAIASANKIYNLNRIYVGQRLYIPSSDYYYNY